MGSNSFISHRMFVAALKGAEPAHPSSAAEASSQSRKLPLPRIVPQLTAGVEPQWLAFPFARGLERRPT